MPISSSAHLILVPWMMGWCDQGLTFDVVLHAGTLIAILSFFWKDWLRMAVGALPRNDDPDRSGGTQLLLMICGTFPAAIAGFVAQKTIETTLRSPFILSITLIGVAGLIWFAERIAKREKELYQMTLPDAISIGSAQALALIPGTSRSGITIATGLFRGLTREAAARFSFLLSAPITAGAGLKKLLDLRAGGIQEADQLPMLFGFLSSLAIGYLTIKFLLRYLQRNTLQLFVVYRVALGVVILVLIRFAGFRP